MLLEIPIKINEFGSKEFFDALLVCSVIQDSQRRKQLIKRLDSRIVNNIGLTDSPNDTVNSILEAFSGFPNKIDELLEAIKRLDPENKEYKKLYEVILTIAKEQQKLCIETVKNSDTLKEMGFNNNDIDENFESLWSKLCLILDAIDWKDIWKGCSHIKEINKKEYIKSLCFTKNYDLLKLYFLDEYDRTLIIKLGESLNNGNEDIRLWLEEAKFQLGATIINPDPNPIPPNVFCFPPILLIIVDRLGDGKDQDKWNVRGQLKLQSTTSEILLSKNKNGIDCPQFENIPIAIKSYIDYLEYEPQFRNQEINNLRIEVFIPLVDLHCHFDNWTIIEEESEHRSLVENYQLFLRSRERVKKNSRVGLLKIGWKKLDVFLENNCSEISKTTIAENINDTQVSQVIEILEKNKISNWKELEVFMKNCSNLWGIRLKDSLSIDRSERMRFFESIFNSGVPIVFWNWESIPLQVQFEEKFTECLLKYNLSNRCCDLLKKTWELRSISWGARSDEERKQYPGYYLGMLLEDPEILPEDNPLQTIGAN
jgi:hypothetical protein